MPAIASVAGRVAVSSTGHAGLRSCVCVLVLGSGRPVGRAGRHPPARPARRRHLPSFACSVARHLGGQVDVAGQVRLAGDRVRLAADRVLEHRALEAVGRRELAAGRLGDGPVDGEADVVVAGRDRDHLEVGFLACCALQKQRSELPSEVASAGIDRPLFWNCGQRADQRRAEVGDDDVDLRVLGDRRRRAPAGSAPGPSWSARTAPAPMNLYLPSRAGPSCSALYSVDALAVARRAAQEQDVAAVGQVLLDPVAPSSCRRVAKSAPTHLS